MLHSQTAKLGLAPAKEHTPVEGEIPAGVRGRGRATRQKRKKGKKKRAYAEQLAAGWGEID